MKHDGRVMKRTLMVAVMASLVLASLAAGLARAAVPDPADTGGPFDLRSVDAAPTPVDRVETTVVLWPGFSFVALPRGATHDLRRHVFVTLEGAPDDDFTNGAYRHYGFFFRRDGGIWFRNGEFGSSPCCWTTPAERVNDTTLRVRFIPWWVRFGEAGNDIAIRYRVATRWCTDEGCVRDHSRWGYA